MIVAQREMLRLAQSELTVSRLEIERYKLMLAKARREQYGQSSERARHLIEQLELAIEDLEETQAAEQAKLETTSPTGQRQAGSPSAAGAPGVAGQSAGREDRRTTAVCVRQVRQHPPAQAR
jgi:hypothetical protein